jgi:hypothetical protein
MNYRVDDLLANYRRMTDGELLELASQKEELTPEARTALETELATRGIADEAMKPEAAERYPEASPEPADHRSSVLFGAQLPEGPSSELVVVFSAESEAEANAAQASLGAAGIESQMQIVVLVPADRAEDALKIVAARAADEDDEEEEPD